MDEGATLRAALPTTSAGGPKCFRPEQILRRIQARSDLHMSELVEHRTAPL